MAQRRARRSDIELTLDGSNIEIQGLNGDAIAIGAELGAIVGSTPIGLAERRSKRSSGAWRWVIEERTRDGVLNALASGSARHARFGTEYRG